MDYSDIKKVEETTNVKLVQAYLDEGGWRILSIAPGQQENGLPCQLYALGWSESEKDCTTYI